MATWFFYNDGSSLQVFVMSKSFVPSTLTPAVLTANRLRDGLSVWMSPQGWATDPCAAVLFQDPALAETALSAAEAQVSVVVDPYLVESGRDEHGRPVAVHFREAFRQSGPSVETSAPHSRQRQEVAHV